MAKTPLELRTLAHLPWEAGIQGDPVDVTPASDSGQFELAEKRRQFRRPALEPSAGPSGIVARVLGADGRALALAVHVTGPTRLERLPEPPLALAARRGGGLWSLEREGLRLLPGDGDSWAPGPANGVRLLGAPQDAVWVVGLEEAWLVTDTSEPAGPFAWRFPLETIAVGNRLVRLDRNKPATLLWLDGAGETEATSFPGRPAAMEHLLAVDGDRVWTSTHDTLQRHGPSGPDLRLAIRGAGLTAELAPFVATLLEGNLVLWRQGHDPLPLPLAPAALDPLGVAVVAVDGERVLAWDGRRRAWFGGGQLESAADLDPEAELSELVPMRWELGGPYCFVATPEGSILVPASGPSGMALLELAFPS